jgi:tRNA-specific adenosine deaminase 1
MELIMAEQEDSSPWPVPSSPNAAEPDSSVETERTDLPGRAYFSQLGVVRRKPARSDAEPTLSKSCSDKLALKQCTSLLSALASLFVEVASAFIDTLVLPRSRYSEVGCDRAFSARGRMAPVVSTQWDEGYAFRPFSVQTTEMEFEYSRRIALEQSTRIAGSNLAAVWTRSGLEETVLGGVIRGRKPFDIRGASSVSRLQMWKTAKGLAEGLDDTRHLYEYLAYSSYKGVKNGPALGARCQVKADTRAIALIGWVVDDKDSDFGIA